MRKGKIGSDCGASQVTYALLISLICLSAIPAISYFGKENSKLWCDMSKNSPDETLPGKRRGIGWVDHGKDWKWDEKTGNCSPPPPAMVF